MIYDFLIDTDVLIWYLRGNEKEYKLIHSLNGFFISSVTYMELIQGMRNKQELNILKNALKSWDVKILYINEEVSSKALFYMQEYFLSHSMQLADSLIGATATTYGLTLITANDKHYKIIKGLEMEVFRS